MNNRDLLVEIARSKNNYCSYLDERHATYDVMVTPALDQSVQDALLALDLSVLDAIRDARLDAIREAAEEADEEPIFTERDHQRVVRVFTFDHIPAVTVPHKGRRNRQYERVNFNPFAHYELTDDGWMLVGLSHWVGGLHNGHFSTEHGRMTDTLGMMLMKLTERFALKGSWRSYSYRDEMVGSAIEHLMSVALQFDEAKTDNPFAYYTSCVSNCFKRVGQTEKKQQRLRDDLLIQAGAPPSMARQLEEELAQFDLPKLPMKRGRKPKAAN